MVDTGTARKRLVDSRAVAAVQARLGRLDEPPWLHAEVARRMAERLALFKNPPRRVVDWGSVLGGGTRLLMDASPKASFTVVEHESLVGRAERALRSPWWSAASWGRSPVSVVADSAADSIRADLIWSNMLLHAVSDPPALFERWQNMLLPEGFVMFSCLGPGSLRGLVDVYARRSWPVPTIDFVDMHDLGDMLVHAGFADPVMDQETLSIQWNSAEALCADLRRLGGNVSPLRFAGLRTPRWMRALSSEFEYLRGSNGKLSLDFEIVYGHAFRATLQRPLKGETRISVEDMRRSMPSAKGTA